jgi:transcriptional regulator with XRE-family HTH domain
MVCHMTSLNPQSSDFHIVLRDKRKALNLTQNQLADALGISSVMTQRYEMDGTKKNRARPGPDTMKKIEAFFAAPTQALNKRPLQDFSLDQLLDEVRHRGFKITLSDV